MSRTAGITVSASWDSPPNQPIDAVRAAVVQVLRTAAQFAQALWYQRAQDLGIRASGAYLQGIQQAQINIVTNRVTGDDLEIAVELVNTAPHADIVENGHPAFSLPKAINWGNAAGRIKWGKKGPYLHIAFRHAAFQTPAQRVASGMTPATLRTMLPREVYQAAKQLTRTVAQRVGPIRSSRLSAPGSPGVQQFLRADNYTRGGRYHDPTPGPRITAGPDGLVDHWRSSRPVQGRTADGQRLTNPAWRSSRFQGLMKTGPAGHTAYVTVRTITPRSAGWNIPAQQGTHCAAQVARVLNGGVGHERFSKLLVEAARGAMGLR